MAAVLKTAEAEASVGSNPTPSARVGSFSVLARRGPTFATSRHRDSSPVRKLPIPARPAFNGQSLEMAIASRCPESDSSTAATCWMKLNSNVT